MKVGIYRGSFDPPHLGHFETVVCGLKSGLERIVVTYVDESVQKPGRQSPIVRLQLLNTLFLKAPQVIISDKSFRETLKGLVNDPGVQKIQVLVGSDLLGAVFRPMPLSEKLGCLLIPRKIFPLQVVPKMWNALPVEVADEENLEDLEASSSALRLYLRTNELIQARKLLTTPLLEEIMSNNFYPSRLREVVDVLLPDQKVTYHVESRGKSDDLVIVIRSLAGKGVFVAKIFGDDKRFETEKLAFQTLAGYPFQYIRVPRIRHIENRMIIMDYVEGRPLAELMQKSPESVRLCAKANGELHSVPTSGATIEVDSEILSRIAIFCPATAERLKMRWEAISKAFLSHPGPGAMVHGDPNHFNWIVDLEKQIVTYIDLSNFSLNGFAMNEFYEAMLTFRLAAKRIGGIEREALQAIRNCYEKEYFTNMTNLNEESRAYFQAYWQLRVIESMLSRGKIPEKEIVDFMK